MSLEFGLSIIAPLPPGPRVGSAQGIAPQTWAQPAPRRCGASGWGGEGGKGSLGVGGVGDAACWALGWPRSAADPRRPRVLAARGSLAPALTWAAGGREWGRPPGGVGWKWGTRARGGGADGGGIGQ